MNTFSQDVVSKLHQAKSKLHSDSNLMEDIVLQKDAVLSRYGKLFNKDNISNLTKEDFQGFLLFKNNHHWTGIHRSQTAICQDMTILRKAIVFLQEETIEIDIRFDKVNDMIKGMGHGIISALLLILNPDNYGAWNRPSEGALKYLNIWPKFTRGDSIGKKYQIINKLFDDLSELLDVDLWTLDAIWWEIKQSKSHEFGDIGIIEEIEPESEIISSQSFGLEKYLHEFIIDNWDLTELSEEWDIYSEDGDDQAGYKYQCDVGEIDILAKHKSENRLLVIELKRNQSSDMTIGQILRYMGSVREEFAEFNYEVDGLIIAKKMDKKLKYAISEVSRVKFKGYKVNFTLD